MAERYTEADRIEIKAALMRALRGERVESVTIAGRTVSYAAAAVSTVVPLLEKKLAEIEEYLNRQNGVRRTRTRIVVSSKGL